MAEEKGGAFRSMRESWPTNRLTDWSCRAKWEARGDCGQPLGPQAPSWQWWGQWGPHCALCRGQFLPAPSRARRQVFPWCLHLETCNPAKALIPVVQTWPTDTVRFKAKQNVWAACVLAVCCNACALSFPILTPTGEPWACGAWAWPSFLPAA